ncbi:MAG: glutamate racemase [Bacteroidota bacterium]
MPKQGPIGFFDSGYGGITVLREVRELLPEYDYLYLGDNARAPYGTRSFDVVYEYTWQGVRTLFEYGCQLVILACNTASAKALRSIQQKELLDYPGRRVLGVVRPSAENIGALSKTGEIVVLATEGTVRSASYPIEFAKFSSSTQVHQHACPMWVPLVESGEYQTPEGQLMITKDIRALQHRYPNADVYLLGCTHYPVLEPFLQTIIEGQITVVSQGKVVAASLESYLKRHSWLVRKIQTGRSVKYMTTEKASVFETRVLELFGLRCRAKQIKISENGID